MWFLKLRFFLSFIGIVLLVFIFFGKSLIVLFILVGIFIMLLCIVNWFFLGNFLICIKGIFGDINFFFNFVNFCNLFGIVGK